MTDLQQQILSPEAKRTITQLYCNKRRRVSSLWMTILFCVSSILYFLVMYNSASLPGNIFINQTLCGLMLGIGDITGLLFADFNDALTTQICFIIIIFFSLSLKFSMLDAHKFYVAYLCLVIVLNTQMSMLYVLQDRRTEDAFASMSLELNLSIGSFMTCVSQPFAKLPEPYPTVWIVIFGIVGLVSVRVI